MEWVRGMNEAVNYIEEHILEEPDLNELGKLAGCSAHHFQRIFTYYEKPTISRPKSVWYRSAFIYPSIFYIIFRIFLLPIQFFEDFPIKIIILTLKTFVSYNIENARS